MLGVFLAFAGMLLRMFGETMNAKFADVDARFESLTMVMTHGFEQVDKRFQQVDKRFEQVDRRLDRIDHRIGGLDSDVQAITRRLLDGPDST